MANLYEQLLAMAAYAADQDHNRRPFNPHPLGCAIPGSGTDQVHRLLLSVYPAALPTAEIRRRTGLGRGCIAWALRYLEHHGRIVVVRFDNRRGPGFYLRYRAADDNEDAPGFQEGVC